jgi:hypothetical protein
MRSSTNLQELIHDLTLEGIVIVRKRKFLWWLDWQHDYPGAWVEFQNRWKKWNPTVPLYVMERSVYIVIVTHEPMPTFEPLSKWAGTDKAAA